MMSHECAKKLKKSQMASLFMTIAITGGLLGACTKDNSEEVERIPPPPNVIEQNGLSTNQNNYLKVKSKAWGVQAELIQPLFVAIGKIESHNFFLDSQTRALQNKRLNLLVQNFAQKHQLSHDKVHSASKEFQRLKYN